MKDDHKPPPEPDDASTDALLALMAEAATLEPGQGTLGVKKLARAGHRAGLDGADMVILMSAARKRTGFPQKLTDAAVDDARRHLDGRGTLSSASAVAEAFVREVTEAGGALLHTDGALYLYDGDPSSADCGTFGVVERDGLHDHMLTTYPAVTVDSSAKRNEVERNVERLTRVPDAFRDAASGLVLRDVTLLIDPKTGALTPAAHSPDHRLRNKVDVIYDPTATCEPFQAALRRVLGNDERAIATFLVFLACVAFRVRLRHDPVRTCLMLYGPPKTGKSTLIRLAQVFVHPSLVTSISPARMGKPENIADLGHSQLNIQTELSPTKKLNADSMKKIFSGEPVETRRLRRDPVSITPTGFHLYATNKLPMFDEAADDSLLRRITVLHMPKPLSDEESEADFWGMIEAHKAGIINLIAAKYAEACETGRFPLPDNQRELGAELLHADDLVGRFVRLYVERRPGCRIKKAALEASIRAFYREHDAHYPDMDCGLMRRASEAMRTAHGAIHGAGGGKTYYDDVGLRADAPGISQASTAPTAAISAPEVADDSTLNDMG